MRNTINSQEFAGYQKIQPEFVYRIYALDRGLKTYCWVRLATSIPDDINVARTISFGDVFLSLVEETNQVSVINGQVLGNIEAGQYADIKFSDGKMYAKLSNTDYVLVKLIEDISNTYIGIQAYFNTTLDIEKISDIKVEKMIIS